MGRHRPRTPGRGHEGCCVRGQQYDNASPWEAQWEVAGSRGSYKQSCTMYLRPPPFSLFSLLNPF